MPAAIHILVYCAFVVVVAVFLLCVWVSGCLRPYRRGIFLGLLFSPVGLVLPYVLFLGVGFLYYGTSPPYDFDNDPSAFGTCMISLLLIGPIVGPSITFLCVIAWHVSHVESLIARFNA